PADGSAAVGFLDLAACLSKRPCRAGHQSGRRGHARSPEDLELSLTIGGAQLEHRAMLAYRRPSSWIGQRQAQGMIRPVVPAGGSRLSLAASDQRETPKQPRAEPTLDRAHPVSPAAQAWTFRVSRAYGAFSRQFSMVAIKTN